MDNKNQNRSTDDLYGQSEQRYSYEQQRSYSRPTSSSEARYRKQKKKRLILLSVLGVVLILLWIVAAVAIVKAVFSDAPADDGDVNTTPASTETDPPSDPEGSGSIGNGDYITVSMDEGTYRTGALILVNAEHKYDQAADKTLFPSLVTVADRYSHSYIVVETDKLRRDLVDAMNEMFDAAYAEKGLANYYFGTPYGWCTTAQQAEDYEMTANKYANPDEREFKAGESEHETGYAFDIKVKVDGKLKYISAAGEEYKWIYDNCYKYGIVYRYPADKKAETGVKITSGTIHYDHFRYVGKAAAAAMHENDWCLEEFIDNITGYTYDGEHLSVTGADGAVYEMYYFPAQESGATEVKIPAGAEYSISGDNVGGYIVTLNIK